MAEKCIHTLQYNSSAQSLSDNDKADLITTKLERHAIALEVLSKHGLIDEYKNAVMSPGKDPEPEEEGLDNAHTGPTFL
jgi:hypothetical protein